MNKGKVIKMASKRQAPVEGQIYKHFKGSLYRIVAIAVHTETSDKLVVYQSIEKPERVFARPLDMFMSEVDRLRYPLVKAKYRFTLLVEAEVVEEDSEPETEVITNTEAKQEECTCKTSEGESSNSEDKKDIVNESTEISETEDIKETTDAIDESDDTAKYKEDGELVLDPYVEAVLDEKEFSKKIENFEFLRNKCTEEMLVTIAISLDIQLEEGTVEEKYAQILKTLRMHEKYESARLRV